VLTLRKQAGSVLTGYEIGYQLESAETATNPTRTIGHNNELF